MLNWNEVFSKNAIEYEFRDVDSEVTPEFVRNLRLKLKLSQKMFAKILGISEKTIEKWEQGSNPIKGTSSRILFLLNKHEDLLDNLYLSKREDETFYYCKAFTIRAVKKPKNEKTENIVFSPKKTDMVNPLCAKNNSFEKNKSSLIDSI